MPRRGGSATSYGVLYQCLGTLTEVCLIRLRGTEGADGLSHATLVVEPQRGGDAHVKSAGASRVIQWKSREGGGTWSLKEVINDVLPDLYQALDVDPDASRVQYIFKTEGRIGSWADARDFFAGCRGPAPADLPGSLDRRAPVGRIGGRPVNARNLFEQVVTAVRKRVPARRERLETTRRRVWRLLGSLEFVWEQSADAERQRVDEMISELTGEVGPARVKHRRNLVGVVLELAAEGNVAVSPRELLRRAGLDVGSFRNWPRVRERLAKHAEQFFVGDSLYRPEVDVRAPPGWPPDRSVVVFSGDSGQGKSWRLAALCRAIGSDSGLVVALRATGNADADLAEVARIICQDGLEQTDTKPFALLNDWRSRVAPDAPNPWLTIFVDGVQLPEEEARPLITKPWNEWRIRLALTVSAAVGGVLRQEFQDTLRVVEIPDFDDDELRDYLGRHGCEWGAMPAELRPTLRRPLLAALYCRLGEASLWRPTREYELYERYWDRLRSAKNQAIYGEDLARMRSLASQLLGPDPIYPWTDDCLLKAGITDEPLRRLEAIGWLRRFHDGRYEVWHSRLLNWAVAEALIGQLRGGQLATDALRTTLKELSGERLYAGQSLGYAAIDALWLLSADEAAVNVVAQAIAEIETVGNSHYPDRFYRYTLSTLGGRVVAALITRVRMSENLEMNPFPRLVARIVAHVAETEPSIAERVVALAGDLSPAVQSLAEHVTALVPSASSASALDPIWSRHAACILAQSTNVNVNELGSFGGRRAALVAASRLAPRWIVDRVNETNDPGLLSELAALLCSLDADTGRGAWTSAKARLFDTLPGDRAGVLADCIGQFNDREELARLVNWTAGDDRLASRAFVALAKIDTPRSMTALSTVSANALASAAADWLPILAIQYPEETDNALRSRLASTDCAASWVLAERIFRGHEWLVGPQVTEYLLESLTNALRDPNPSGPGANRAALRNVLHVLAGTASREALARFETRSGSVLDDSLCALACSWIENQHVPEFESAKAILRKIRPASLATVARAELAHESPSVRQAGMWTCAMAEDRQSVPLLRDRVLREDAMSTPRSRDETEGAVEALASLAANQDVVEAVLRWGLDVAESLPTERRTQPALPDETLASALHALSSPDPIARGRAALAIGMSGRQDLAPRVRQVLADAPADGTASRDAMVALACGACQRL